METILTCLLILIILGTATRWTCWCGWTSRSSPTAWSATRLIGVIEAEQTERDGQAMRNDRLIAVAAVAQSHGSIQALDQLEDTTVAEIENFFVSYNQVAGKEFKPLGRGGPDRARALVDEGARRKG